MNVAESLVSQAAPLALPVDLAGKTIAAELADRYGVARVVFELRGFTAPAARRSPLEG